MIHLCKSAGNLYAWAPFNTKKCGICAIVNTWYLLLLAEFSYMLEEGHHSLEPTLTLSQDELQDKIKQLYAQSRQFTLTFLKNNTSLNFKLVSIPVLSQHSVTIEYMVKAGYPVVWYVSKQYYSSHQYKWFLGDIYLHKGKKQLHCKINIQLYGK